jgi:hypothetical protein
MVLGGCSHSICTCFTANGPSKVGTRTEWASASKFPSYGLRSLWGLCLWSISSGRYCRERLLHLWTLFWRSLELMKALIISLLCALALSSVKADDEELSAALVGTWSTSFDQPIYDGSLVHIRIVIKFQEDGQFIEQQADAGKTSGTIQAQGNWEINSGELTLNYTRWSPPQLPTPNFDDGPTVSINFTSPNSFYCHRVNWIRH